VAEKTVLQLFAAPVSALFTKEPSQIKLSTLICCALPWTAPRTTSPMTRPMQEHTVPQSAKEWSESP
jgi:hypothetical protein